MTRKTDPSDPLDIPAQPVDPNLQRLKDDKTVSTLALEFATYLQTFASGLSTFDPDVRARVIGEVTHIFGTIFVDDLSFSSLIEDILAQAEAEGLVEPVADEAQERFPATLPELGATFAAARAECGFTQDEIGFRVQQALQESRDPAGNKFGRYTWVALFEQGRRKPSAHRIAEYASLVGLDVEVFESFYDKNAWLPIPLAPFIDQTKLDSAQQNKAIDDVLSLFTGSDPELHVQYISSVRGTIQPVARLLLKDMVGCGLLNEKYPDWFTLTTNGRSRRDLILHGNTSGNGQSRKADFFA